MLHQQCSHTYRILGTRWQPQNLVGWTSAFHFPKQRVTTLSPIVFILYLRRVRLIQALSLKHCYSTIKKTSSLNGTHLNSLFCVTLHLLNHKPQLKTTFKICIQVTPFSLWYALWNTITNIQPLNTNCTSSSLITTIEQPLSILNNLLCLAIFRQ